MNDKSYIAKLKLTISTKQPTKSIVNSKSIEPINTLLKNDHQLILLREFIKDVLHRIFGMKNIENVHHHITQKTDSHYISA